MSRNLLKNLDRQFAASILMSAALTVIGPIASAIPDEAEFFYEKMESMIFQFFRKDYRRVYNGLEDILGKPSKESSKRISGPLGPTANKNKTTIWKQPDYSIMLQSRPVDGRTSLMRFYTNTYPLRLKEPFEKQLKDPSKISTYNRKHYENWIKTIENKY